MSVAAMEGLRNEMRYGIAEQKGRWEGDLVERIGCFRPTKPSGIAGGVQKQLNVWRFRIPVPSSPA